MQNTKIYTDGAYSSSRDQGGWAFVILQDNLKIAQGFDGTRQTTNNRMEIQSVIEALKYCKSNNINEFELFSDSMYVIGTMTLNWKKKKNVDLWLILDELKENLQIKWTHEKGHSGDKWNEHCDMLAVHGSHLKL